MKSVGRSPKENWEKLALVCQEYSDFFRFL